MTIIILLISISLIIAVVFLVIFLWSMKSGQYDDMYTPSVRMLFDNKKKKDTSANDKDRQPHQKV
ncbi:MAG TPA: cbb3-type cytochrome oxidase assembly protein CcoS [Cyclobacteriaceae bacterium]|nr:cbb3-type cytochrome oxidase assembly protein CcoS [Cyclobacteriaceae bacterium]